MNEQVKERGGWVRRLIKRIAIGTAISFAATYAVFAVPFFSRSPVIKTHYVREFNETLIMLPEDDHAWRDIRRAWFMQSKLNDPWPDHLRGAILTPDSPDWKLVKEMIERRRDAFEVLAAAVKLPRLGMAVTNQPDPALESELPVDAELSLLPSPLVHADVPVMFVLPMHLGPMRAFARDLSMRMVIRAEEGDGPGVLEDLTTMLNLSRLCAEPPSLMSTLVQMSICVKAETSLAYIIAAYPGILNDNALADAQAQFAHAAQRLVPDFSWERNYWLDYQQRVFSDDGAGDGRLTYGGFEYLRMIAGKPRSPWVFITGPFVSPSNGTRREFTAAFESMFAAALKDWDRPVWERAASSGERRAGALEGQAYPPLIRLMAPICESYVGYVRTLQISRMRMQSVVVWLGIERYRLRFGQPPASLDLLKDFGVAAIPTDIFDGQELGYGVGNVGPVLYSVGANGNDDRGVPTERPDDAQFIRTKRELDELAAANPGRFDGDWILWPPFAAVDGDTVESIVTPRRATKPAPE